VTYRLAELKKIVKSFRPTGCECENRFFVGLEALTWARKKSIPLHREFSKTGRGIDHATTRIGSAE
jgi:hypothetical protein